MKYFQNLPRVGSTRLRQAGTQAVDRQWRTADQTGVIVRAVCSKCNNGWMSALEGKAETLLAPLIKGEHPRLISREEGETISLWALKTAMVFDVNRKPAFFSATERQSLSSGKGIPSSALVTVALAPYVGGFTTQYLHSDIQLRLVSKDGQLATGVGFVGTMSIGRMVLQLGALRTPDLKPISLGINPAWRHYSRWLRPFVADVVWSPTEMIALDDALFVPYGHRWLPDGEKPSGWQQPADWSW